MSQIKEEKNDALLHLSQRLHKGKQKFYWPKQNLISYAQNAKFNLKA